MTAMSGIGDQAELIALSGASLGDYMDAVFVLDGSIIFVFYDLRQSAPDDAPQESAIRQVCLRVVNAL
jgi:hypothetical protein